MHRLAVVASILSLLVACSKSQSPPPTAESAAISALPPAASSAPAASAPTTSASTAPPDSTTLAAADGAKSATAPKETGAKTADGADSGACGTKPLPDCPLQAWMKKNMNPPALAGDTAALADALDKAAAFAPPGYTNWSSIAKDGAKAAKSGDLAAAKNACRSCHDQYKKKYKAELRGRKI